MARAVNFLIQLNAHELDRYTLGVTQHAISGVEWCKCCCRAIPVTRRCLVLGAALG